MNAKVPITLTIWIRVIAVSLVALLPYCFGMDGFVADAGQQASLAAKDGARVAKFQKGVQEYVALHRRLEGPLPTLEVSDDPKEIQASIDALAMEIRAARVTARQGDIFTDEIARLFRRLIQETLTRGETRNLLAAIAEENPRPLARARMNGSYPAGTSLSWMSPKLLSVFPELPEELQYRFVNRDLILWDYHANLIVDVVPNAIPPDLT